MSNPKHVIEKIKRCKTTRAMRRQQRLIRQALRPEPLFGWFPTGYMEDYRARFPLWAPTGGSPINPGGAYEFDPHLTEAELLDMLE